MFFFFFSESFQSANIMPFYSQILKRAPTHDRPWAVPIPLSRPSTLSVLQRRPALGPSSELLSCSEKHLQLFFPLQSKTQAPFTRCSFVSAACLLCCFPWHGLCLERPCSACCESPARACVVLPRGRSGWRFWLTVGGHSPWRLMRLPTRWLWQAWSPV